MKMQSAHDNAEWNDFFNKSGYNTLGNSGSVHDYFIVRAMDSSTCRLTLSDR